MTETFNIEAFVTVLHSLPCAYCWIFHAYRQHVDQSVVVLNFPSPPETRICNTRNFPALHSSHFQRQSLCKDKNLEVVHFVVFTFFFGRSTAGGSERPAVSASLAPSAISSSEPVLSCAESYSSATSDSESVRKSSSTLSSSSSADPRSARSATTSSSDEAISASLRAAAMRALDCR